MSSKPLGPAQRWADELQAWAIPEEILAQAVESPWGFPPELFGADEAPDGYLHRLAREALAEGGSVLDIGCGGGAASIPLAPSATHLTGVDSSPAMLESYARSAEAAGVAYTVIEGGWPEAAGRTPTADVVVCRNVVYNVAEIIPFVRALTTHAARRVVVELTDVHPSVALAPLWKHFWGLDRPTGPSADLFVDVLGQAGIVPAVRRETRPAMMARVQLDEHVAFVRRRLCLDPSRQDEVARAIQAVGSPSIAVAVVVAWDRGSRGVQEFVTGCT